MTPDFKGIDGHGIAGGERIGAKKGSTSSPSTMTSASARCLAPHFPSHRHLPSQSHTPSHSHLLRHDVPGLEEADDVEVRLHDAVLGAIEDVRSACDTVEPAYALLGA